MNNSKKIGIVSGIGPLAGSDVLAKVFKNAAKKYDAIEDNEYPDLILLNHGIVGVGNTGTLNLQFENELLNMVHHLEAQGATIIGIACNTAHSYLDKIKINSGVSLVNLLDAVARTAAETSETYLLLTSATSKSEGIYNSYLEKHGVTFNQSDAEQQKMLNAVIELVMAHRLSESGELMDRVLSSASARGFTAVIAGCTELPIAIAHSKNPFGLAVIDSNEVLALALVDAYYRNSTSVQVL